MHEFIDKTLETFEMIATAISELHQRVEALEQKSIVDGPVSHMKTPVFTMPKYQTLDETDRSHDVVIGARVDSSHSGS
jgi:hypothetical protein